MPDFVAVPGARIKASDINGMLSSAVKAARDAAFAVTLTARDAATAAAARAAEASDRALSSAAAAANAVAALDVFTAPLDDQVDLGLTRAGALTRAGGTWPTVAKAHVLNVNDFGAISGNGAADDQPIIQAAINETASKGLAVFFPKPAVAYQLGAPLVLPAGATLLGSGRGLRPALRSSVGDVVQLGFAGSATGVTIDGMSLVSQFGGGDVIHTGPGSCSFFQLRNFGLTQENVGRSAFHVDAGSMSEGFIGGGFVTHKPTATVPTFYIKSNNDFNVCRIERLRMRDSGDYSIHVENLGSDFISDLSLYDINFQQCLGGEVRLLSVRNAWLEKLVGYDATTYTKDRYRIGKSPTGSASTGIHLKGIARRGGALAAGVSDVHFVAGEAGRGTLEGVNGAIDLGSNGGMVVLGLDSSSPAGTLLNPSENINIYNGGETRSRRVVVGGSGGNGFTEWAATQSVTPASPAAGARQFLTSTGSPALVYPDGRVVRMDGRRMPSGLRFADHTLTLADMGTAILMSNSSQLLQVIVPLEATLPLPIGYCVEIQRHGAGPVTIAGATADVVIRSRQNMRSVLDRYGTVELTKRSANEWFLAGDLTV